jgi:hypothetical protein
MGISLLVLWLECLGDGGRPDGMPVSHLILLTSLTHVNRPGPKILPRRIQIDPDEGFHSSVYALELTVPHKTVAEPH